MSLFSNFDRVNREIFTVLDPWKPYRRPLPHFSLEVQAWRTGRFPKWK